MGSEHFGILSYTSTALSRFKRRGRAGWFLWVGGFRRLLIGILRTFSRMAWKVPFDEESSNQGKEMVSP